MATAILTILVAVGAGLVIYGTALLSGPAAIILSGLAIIWLAREIASEVL